MARLEETPGLFGLGIGIGTIGRLRCDVCRRTYNPDADEEGRLPSGVEGESVGHTEFAGLTVCELCFEVVEDEILGRLDDILPWVARHIAEARRRVSDSEKMLDEIQKGLT